jgi:predicted metalloendopeptidase
MHFSLTNDPHSLDRFRVLGTVENSDEFSKAFSCKSKKSDKCQLW